MKNVDIKKVFARRELIGAGAVGVAYLMLPEACGGGSSGTADAGPQDSMAPEAGDAGAGDAEDASSLQDAEPDATLVEGGGDCKQTDWTRPISIMKAGIALKGTAYAFTDDRFLDLTLQGNRILVINPLKGSGFVAMSGVCTHEGCSPKYFSTCIFSKPGGIPQCVAEDAGDGGEDGSGGGSDAETLDGGSDAESAEAGADGSTEADGGSEVLTDVLFCPCHRSVFDATNGDALSGPALGAGDLQILDTCVGGGYVFVTIPKNPGAP
jgi:nitrite reductase/ring-hydroxylating ferredoxin subunit